jgi:hypothetical protein
MSEVARVRDVLLPRIILSAPPDIADELRAILPLLKRDQHKPRYGRTTAKRVTAAIRDAVKAAVMADPSAPNRDIGRRFGIDGGRVSEIIAGQYDHLDLD